MKKFALLFRFLYVDLVKLVSIVIIRLSYRVLAEQVEKP